METIPALFDRLRETGARKGRAKGRVGMESHKRMSELIESAWKVIQSDFDEHAIRQWRELAADYLAEAVGDSHRDTCLLKDKIRLNDVLLQSVPANALQSATRLSLESSAGVGRQLLQAASPQDRGDVWSTEPSGNEKRIDNSQDNDRLRTAHAHHEQ